MTFLKTQNLGPFDLFEDLVKATKEAWLNRSDVDEIRYALMKHLPELSNPLDKVSHDLIVFW